MSLTSLPIGPNPGQKNFDQIQNEINLQATDGVAVPASPLEGRPFQDGDHNLFGYNGVIVADGKVIALINLDENSNVPRISIGDKVLLVGDSQGYIPSGHTSGQRADVIALTEPFLQGPKGTNTSDRVIQVNSGGIIGWIKPSNVDKEDLTKQSESRANQLFTKGTE
jgi:hypothetical protein